MKKDPAFPIKSCLVQLDCQLYFMHKTQTVCLSVEECCSQCVEGDLADLQTHQAGEENHPLQGQNASEEVPSGHLRVSEPLR